MVKFLILDAGPFISLTTNGLIKVLENLKKKFPEIEMILTPQVKREVIDRPLKIKKYELEAIKVMDLLDKKVIKMSSEFVQNGILEKETSKVIQDSNSLLTGAGETIRPIQEGEASCLAFSKLCGKENLIVIDERTTRLLTESPENLHKLMERKVHMKLNLNKKNIKYFKDFKYIRSAELLFMAYKNDLLELKKDPVVLDAILYGVKFRGTAISSREIEEMKKLA